jgi:hypothetical protein
VAPRTLYLSVRPEAGFVPACQIKLHGYPRNPAIFGRTEFNASLVLQMALGFSKELAGHDFSGVASFAGHHVERTPASFFTPHPSPAAGALLPHA